MPADTVDLGDETRPSHRARRTEAMPKVSLFGSSLEILNEESAQSVRDLEPSKVPLPRTPGGKGPGQRFCLPEDVKRKLPGAEVVENSRRDFEQIRNRVNDQKNELRRREEESLYNQTRIQPQPSSQRHTGTAKPQWFSEQDLQGSDQINCIGLNMNQSFNRDKYGQKPPVHNYSLIGDVMRPGMDFPRRERTEIQMRNQGYGAGDLRGVLAPSPVKGPPTQQPRTARPPSREIVVLPQNIKHTYGTKVCDKLLADKDIVQKTIRDQKDRKEEAQRKSKPFCVPEFNKSNINPDYDMLGNALRMNVVPGYSTDNKISTTKTAFNDQVHLFRNPDPDKWRYQKDELSRWAEHNVLRQRMTKAWEAYFIETLQKKAQQQ